MQVIKTFCIRDLFCEAINLCTNIDDSDFPLLSKNKSSGGGNVSKITITEHCCYMTSFRFESVPRLKDMFSGIELFLKRVVSGLRGEIDSKQTASVLVKDLQKTIMGCKSSLHTLTNWFAGIEEKLKTVEKKVKDLEKKEEQETSPF